MITSTEVSMSKMADAIVHYMNTISEMEPVQVKRLDEDVWLSIYCASLNRGDTTANSSAQAADIGLGYFKDRFRA